MKASADDLIQLIRKEFPDVSGSEFDGSADPSVILGNSSLNLLYIRSLILDHFEVILTDDDIRESRSVSELVDRINGKQ